jgi:hypothetical protein
MQSQATKSSIILEILGSVLSLSPTIYIIITQAT